MKLIISFLEKLKNTNFVFLISIFTFLTWYIFLGFKVVDQPFIWDDLHQIRSFSFFEIRNSWIDNWFLHDVETPSYRPMAIIFFHIIGSFFGENYVLARVFYFFLMIILIMQINFLFVNLKFKKINIVIFSFFLIFAKIFSTLLSWFTLGFLIFCYILALISIHFFLKWTKDKKPQYFILSFFFAFLAIFTREELYILPGVIFIILLINQKSLFENLTKNTVIFLSFSLIVFTHIILRQNFVVESAQFNIDFFSIRYGNEKLGFGYFIKALKSSLLPMGYWSLKNTSLFHTVIFSIWTLSITTGIILTVMNKKILNIKNFEIFIFISLIFLLCLPNIITGRAFGIFLPSIVFLFFTSLLMTKINLIKKNFKNNKILNSFCNFIIILIFISGITGGYYRSNEHLKAMNANSEHIVFYDSFFIYGLQNKNLKIPEDRYAAKKKHLENLNIYNMRDAKSAFSKNSTNIMRTKFKPLSF